MQKMEKIRIKRPQAISEEDGKRRKGLDVRPEVTRENANGKIILIIKENTIRPQRKKLDEKRAD